MRLTVSAGGFPTAFSPGIFEQKGTVRFAVDWLSATGQQTSPRILRFVLVSAWQKSIIRLCLDRTGRGFHPGGICRGSSRRRAADNTRPVGSAHRHRRDLLFVRPELRTQRLRTISIPGSPQDCVGCSVASSTLHQDAEGLAEVLGIGEGLEL